MKRPLALFGLTFLLTAACLSFVGIEITKVHITAALAAAAALLLSICVKRLRKNKIPILISSAVFAGAAAFICCSVFFYMPVSALADGSYHTVKAAFCELPYKNGNFRYYRLKTESVDGAPKSLYFTLVTVREYDFEPYDEIEARLTFEKETYSSSIADRVYLSAYSNKNFRVIKTNCSSFAAVMLKIRKALLASADSLYSTSDAPFVKAVLLGDRTGLSAELTDTFRTAGISHMLVISGLHMSIISGVFLSLLRKIFRSRRLANVLTALPVIGFMALTGFPPSLTRAGITVVTALTGDCLFRDSDPLNSLGFAALVLCLPNPFAAFDIGLLMSFAATAGIIIYYPRMYGFIISKLEFLSEKAFIYRPACFIASLVSVSVCASVAILPFSLLLFGQVSNISLISNIILVPILPAVMALCALSILCFCFYPLLFLAAPIAFIASILIRTIISVAEFLAALPFSHLYVTKPYVSWCITAAVAAAAVILLLKKRRLLLPSAALVLSAVLLICSVSDAMRHLKNAEIKVYSDGKGYLVSLEAESTLTMLYSSSRAYPPSKFADIITRSCTDVSLFCVLNNISSTRSVTDCLCENARVGNLCLSCDRQAFEPSPSKIYSGTEIDFIQHDCIINICGGVTAELVNINSDFAAILNISGNCVLILPNKIKASGFSSFAGKYGLSRFSLIISGESFTLPDEFSDFAGEIFRVPSYTGAGTGGTKALEKYIYPLQ